MKRNVTLFGAIFLLYACEEKAERPGGSPSKPQPSASPSTGYDPYDPAAQPKATQKPETKTDSETRPETPPDSRDETPVIPGKGSTGSTGGTGSTSGVSVPPVPMTPPKTTGPDTTTSGTASTTSLPAGECAQLAVEHTGGGGVTLRTAPRPSADPLAVLETGAPVRNLGKAEDGYYKVRTSDGKEGYVWGTLLKCVETGKLMVESKTNSSAGTGAVPGGETRTNNGAGSGSGSVPPNSSPKSRQNLPEEQCDEVKP